MNKDEQQNNLNDNEQIQIPFGFTPNKAKRPTNYHSQSCLTQSSKINYKKQSNIISPKRILFIPNEKTQNQNQRQANSLQYFPSRKKTFPSIQVLLLFYILIT